MALAAVVTAVVTLDTGRPAIPAATTGLGAPADVNASAPPANGSSMDASAPRETSTDAVARFLEVSTSIGMSSDPQNVARDSALSDLKALRTELDVNGWSVTGEPSIDDVTIVAEDRSVGTATIRACVDSSAVTVLLEDGSPAFGESVGSQRSAQLFTLASINDRWYVTATSFPDDAAC